MAELQIHTYCAELSISPVLDYEKPLTDATRPPLARRCVIFQPFRMNANVTLPCDGSTRENLPVYYLILRSHGVIRNVSIVNVCNSLAVKLLTETSDCEKLEKLRETSVVV